MNDCYLLEWVTLFSEANLCVLSPVMYIIHAIMGRMKRPARLQFVNGRVLTANILTRIINPILIHM